ncbi:MAG: glycosyl transferase family 1 [Armatimonadota bacterium]|nr:MAG: glycosyl transferase family 1 [Armatimonadota bacterium]
MSPLPAGRPEGGLTAQQEPCPPREVSMRVLLFSKAAIRAVYHKQYEHIAAQPGVNELLVVAPPYWREPRVGRLTLEEIHPRNYRLEVTPLRWNGQYHLYYAPQLPRLMREFHPDLVHIDEEVYNFATFHAALTAWRIEALTVAFCWQNIYRRYPPPFRWFELVLAKRLSGVVAGNADAMQVLRRKGFTLPINIIPQYGVDIDTFTPGSPPVPPPFHVGYLGRLVPAKGIDVLLESLQWLPEHCQLWVAGDGDESPWRAMAERLGVAERVRWLGAIPSRQVADFLRGLHVLVLPSRTTSRWKEQFGRVLVEAMACGVPVIGSDSGEIPRVIGNAGLVFAEGNAVHLANLIRLLAEKPALRGNLAQTARRRAVEQFSMERIAMRTVTFWQELLVKSGNSC